MISAATLHEVVGILRTDADLTTAAAHLAAEYHGLPAAQAKLARARKLRGYAAEIQAHLVTPPAEPAAPLILHCSFCPHTPSP